MVAKIVLAFALVAAALADRAPAPAYGSKAPPAPSYGSKAPASYQEEESSAEYNFEWSVKDDDSGNDFGHEESRDGDNTKGSYFVLLPDGRTQKVTYYVNGDSGYVAEVTYEGEAASYEQPQQSYSPAPQKQSYSPPKQAPQAYAPPAKAARPRYN